MSVEKAVYARLSTATGLTALTSTRIAPAVNPQGVTYPSVTFRVISEERVTAMGSDPGIARARVQVDAWSDDFAEAEPVANQVRAALQRYRGTSATVEVLDVFVLNRTHLYQEDPVNVHQVSQDFEVIYRE